MLRCVLGLESLVRSRCWAWPPTPGRQAEPLYCLHCTGHPSSGNTWLRYLIQGVAGRFTGSWYNDPALRRRGFYGEGVPWVKSFGFHSTYFVFRALFHL